MGIDSINAAMMEEGEGMPPPDAMMPPPPDQSIVPPTATTAIGQAINLTDEEKTALKTILTTITKPDDDIREKMVPIWQMYENYWRGLQDVVYDPDLREFRSATGVIRAAGELEDTYIGSKIVNVYRAHGESIASAISSETPKVRFYPEDAEDPQDITTAKTYSIASEFIADDNEARLLHLRAVYTRWNQPFVAYYNTYVYDEEKYGTIERRTYKTIDQEMSEAYCPECTEELPVQTPNSICPTCGVEAIQSSSIEPIPVIATINEIPRGREKIEVYGPRHLRVPYNVKSLEQAGYLILETEHHWAQLKQIFQHLDINSGSPAQSGTADTARTARRAGEGGITDQDQKTLERCWFRPWTFNLIEGAIADSLRAKFKKGVQVTFVDGEFVEAFNENVDEHWTIVFDPYAEHIHGDPLGKVEIPIQDMTNDVVQLTLEHILFGIPDRFADPSVLNFKKYAEATKAPGNVYAAKRPAGMGLDAGFFEGKATTLSDNIEIFRQSLEQYGQFVTGDFPGIHGGPLPSGSSRTADEYRQMKQSALQRLSVTWFLLTLTWSKVMKKAVNEMRLHMIFQGEDVKFVKEAGKGFTNVYIKLADIDDGNVGRVRPENDEGFPLSTEQKRGVMMELLQTGIPQLFEWMFTPENMSEATRILIGMNNFKIPGEDDREYQLWEINNILIGQMVQVDPDLDNHEIHATTLRSWASSENGRKTKEINPQGWAMVMEHLQMHMMILEQIMMQQQANAAAQAAQTAPPKKGGQAEKSGAVESTGGA